MGISKYTELNDKEWLYQKYWVEGLPTTKIGELLGCRNGVVLKALRRLDIPVRTMSEAKKKYSELDNHDFLYQKYHEEDLSIIEIAALIGCCGDAVWRALKKFEITIRSPSDAHKGKHAYWLGKHHSRKTCDKISKSRVGKPLSESCKRKLSELNKGTGNPNYGKPMSESQKEKISKARRGKYSGKNHPWYGKHHSERTKQKLREARKKQILPRHHTTPERIFEDICKKYNLHFKYVGDGSLWIGKEKHLNPDFIQADGQKIVVEIFGDYWHSPLLNPKIREDATLDYRKKHYKKYGWKSYFFFETDLLRSDAGQYVLSVLNSNSK